MGPEDYTNPDLYHKLPVTPPATPTLPDPPKKRYEHPTHKRRRLIGQTLAFLLSFTIYCMGIAACILGICEIEFANLLHIPILLWPFPTTFGNSLSAMLYPYFLELLPFEVVITALVLAGLALVGLAVILIRHKRPHMNWVSRLIAAVNLAFFGGILFRSVQNMLYDQLLSHPATTVQLSVNSTFYLGCTISIAYGLLMIFLAWW